ncbi:MAG: hypothetical protein M3Z95_04790, partial [Actinomycetota bacterium]|nr:hypothetical protein [Actinomycetota bacterium]
HVGGGVIAWRGGTAFRLESRAAAPVVSWLRAGHLCVLSGRGVNGATLLRLASWGDQGSVSA